MRRPSTSKPNTSQKLIEAPVKTNAKSNIVKEIEKLKQKIESTNDDIKKTEKLLDVDLFLKQQKQKRLEYAKNLTADFEAQKKVREEKLYKKHKREQKQQPKQDNKDKIQFKIQNVASFTPILIVKTILNQGSMDEWVKDGHHYKPDDIECEGLRQREQKLFANFYKSNENKPKYDGQFDNKRIAWKYFKQVAENPLEIETMPNKIPENSLIPNDTHSESIMSALVLLQPKIVSQTFAENDKVYLAQLFLPNRQVTVIVDKYLLVRQFTHKYVNLGSRSHDPNILWPTLIEKCYDKLQVVKKASHLSTSVNRTIYTIFGLDAELVPISNKNVIKQNIHLVLGHLLQEGRVGFMNLGRHSTKAYENRMYVLEEVRQWVQKRGDLQKKEMKFKIKNPWRGKLIDSQNNNNFNLLQLLQIFNCVVLIRDYPKKWSCLRINANYFSNGGVGISGNQWTKNPQYLFTVSKSMYVRIVLRKSAALDSSANEGVYGFLLFQNKEASNKIEALKMDWLVTKTKSNQINQASYTDRLKGNYILIPYTTDKSEGSYQFFVLDFFVQKQANLQFGKARIHDYNYVPQKGSRLNSEDSKIIQSLEAQEKFQRPRVQKVDIPEQFAPRITEKILEKLNLNLYKDVSVENFFIPGMISSLLINKSVEVQLRQDKKTKNPEVQTNQQQLANERAQDLQILLGYDAMSEEINQGLMKQYMEQSVGIYDIRNYCLGEEGMIAVLETLGEHPQIIELDLAYNELNDSAIAFLCYYMEKGKRTELRKLDVSHNNFGKMGRCALEGLKGTFPKLIVVGL